MKFSDTIKRISSTTQVNANGDTEEVITISLLGKCIILANGISSQGNGNDGPEYVTQYEVIMKTPSYIPKENDMVHITKEDLSIDKDCRVVGFVTMKKVWLKLWLK